MENEQRRLIVLSYVIISNQGIQLLVAFSVLALLFTRVAVSTGELNANNLASQQKMDRNYGHLEMIYAKQIELLRVLDEVHHGNK